jgi:hypothetical protein
MLIITTKVHVPFIKSILLKNKIIVCIVISKKENVQETKVMAKDRLIYEKNDFINNLSMRILIV